VGVDGPSTPIQGDWGAVAMRSAPVIESVHPVTEGITDVTRTATTD
jgi:hypothetical protein